MMAKVQIYLMFSNFWMRALMSDLSDWIFSFIRLVTFGAEGRGLEGAGGIFWPGFSWPPDSRWIGLGGTIKT